MSRSFIPLHERMVIEDLNIVEFLLWIFGIAIDSYKLCTMQVSRKL
jgi:hypothetical protein